MQEASLVFYHAPICPYCQKVQIALMLKNIRHEIEEIDLKNKPDWFFSISPSGTVPILKVGEEIISESEIINEYLEDAYPHTDSLRGKNAVQSAKIRQWITWFNQKLVSHFYQLLKATDSTQQEEQARQLTGALYLIEEGLFKKTHNLGPFLFGGMLSLADISLYPFIERFVVLEVYRGFIFPQDCVSLRTWFEKMKQIPEIACTNRPVDYYLQHYASYANICSRKS